MPGAAVTVLHRDVAGDAVRLREAHGDVVTIGARAASKVLVSHA
jgi:hypothetical protein